jgi:PAS domain S-box-containing protein
LEKKEFSMDAASKPGDPMLAVEQASLLTPERFRQFLDHLPFAVAVSEISAAERIIYINIEFQRLTGQSWQALEGKSWSALPGRACDDDARPLSEAITQSHDYIGVFTFEYDGDSRTVDAWSSVIHDDHDAPMFRLIALATAAPQLEADLTAFERRIRDKDLQLRELQHRVANNLALITALIRVEARNVQERASIEQFSRLAGRVEALGLLYRSLSDEGKPETVDLGAYLSGIASAVMRAHAVEGIHFDLQLDLWLVSINVALPTGLVVNELLTNSLKHGFDGHGAGTITLKSLVDGDGCRVSVSDNGVGLTEGVGWPREGKLSNLMVQSLRQNAKAQIDVVSLPGKGMQVTIFLARTDNLRLA